jgi:hypothetical protein
MLIARAMVKVDRVKALLLKRIEESWYEARRVKRKERER